MFRIMSTAFVRAKLSRSPQNGFSRRAFHFFGTSVLRTTVFTNSSITNINYELEILISLHKGLEDLHLLLDLLARAIHIHQSHQPHLKIHICKVIIARREVPAAGWLICHAATISSRARLVDTALRLGSWLIVVFTISLGLWHTAAAKATISHGLVRVCLIRHPRGLTRVVTICVVIWCV